MKNRYQFLILLFTCFSLSSCGIFENKEKVLEATGATIAFAETIAGFDKASLAVGSAKTMQPEDRATIIDAIASGRMIVQRYQQGVPAEKFLTFSTELAALESEYAKVYDIVSSNWASYSQVNQRELTRYHASVKVSHKVISKIIENAGLTHQAGETVDVTSLLALMSQVASVSRLVTLLE